MHFVIGIDGGGTKTEAVLADRAGNPLDRIVAGATNPHAVTFAVAEERLAGLLDRLLSHPELQQAPCRAVCLGLSGVDREEERARVRSFLEKYAAERQTAFHIFIENDAKIALMAACGQPHGIIVISGTGSIAYGMTPDGAKYRVGGWGHLLGDEGSGYAIGRMTLQAAMQSFDGVLPETALTRLILDKLSLPSLDELKHYIYKPEIQKQHIAEFAALCIQAGGQGDRVALDILERAAKELAAQAATLRGKHAWFEACGIAVVGSLFKHSPFYLETFTAELRRVAPGIAVTVSERPPADGAAHLALYLLKQLEPE